MSFDPVLDTPTFIRSTTAFLTRRSAEDAESIAANFVNAHPALFRRGSLEASEFRVLRDYTTSSLGVRHFTFQQRHNGQDVYGCLLTANVTSDGMLVNIGSSLVPAPETPLDPPECGARDAVAAACEAMNDDRAATLLALIPVEAECATDWAAGQHLGGTGVDSLFVRSVLFPVSATQLAQAWLVILPGNPAAGNARFECVIDDEGTPLTEAFNWTLACRDPDPVTFKVYAGDSPVPGTPGAAAPDMTDPYDDTELPFRPPCYVNNEDCRQLIFVTSSTTGTASPQGWINDFQFEHCTDHGGAASQTCGNNAIARSTASGETVVGTARLFDLPLDLSQPPAAYEPAGVVQAFFLANLWHDRMYSLGFDEPAGNYQQANFGTWGEGGDPIRILLHESIDSVDYGQTSLTGDPPADGNETRVRLESMTGPTPNRSAALDATVVYHELTHAMTARLVVGQSFGPVQTRGMLEGWADFFAIALTAESADDFSASYPVFSYASREYPPRADHLNHYYYGARMYPYSADLVNMNPLRYGYIDPADAVEFPYPDLDIPRNLMFHNIARSETYRVGEVWATTLLHSRTSLSQAGLAFEANELMMQLAVDAHKLCPGRASFLDARDALLQADLLRYDGTHHVTLWQVFALRGMGPGADSVGATATVDDDDSLPIDASATSFFYPSDYPPLVISPHGTTEFDVYVSNVSEPIEAVRVLTTPQVGATATQIAGSHYRVVLPATTCRQSIDLRLEAEVGSGVATDPPGTLPAYHMVAGLSEVAFEDDMEENRGWTTAPAGPPAPPGALVRVIPLGGPLEPWRDATLGEAETQCWVTQNRQIGQPPSSTAYDVDSTEVTLTSPGFSLESDTVAVAELDLWHASAGGAPADVECVVEWLRNGTPTTIASLTPATASVSWRRIRTTLATENEAGAVWQLRVRFMDPGADSSVEGGVDNVLISCVVQCCDGDYNRDGNNDQDDINLLVDVVAGGPNPGGLDPDFNQDGNVDAGDIAALVDFVASAECP
ncbi:MAG: M36 family metallopeptidase [Phycisphaerales bacterium]